MITQPAPFPFPQRRTLRSWLSGVMKSFDQSVGVVAEGCAEAAQQPALIQTGELRVIPAQPGASGQPRAEVLPFPLHGEALLVKLADALRRRVAGRQPDHNPLCLTILRTPRVRLSIDGSAYVDYLSELSVYQAAIDATPDTKVILKTTDFDALASFVVQYVDDRLIERSSSKETAP